MGELDEHLQRLLKLASAAKVEGADAAQAPFGFDTRIVAQWRELRRDDPRALARLVRRVAFVAIAITVVGSAAVYRQINEDDEIGESLTNDYALVDSMIEKQILQ